MGLPVPGQEFVEPGLWQVGDADENIGEPGLRVDVVELGGADERVHHSRPLAAAIGAGEEPGSSPETQGPQRALGGVVRQADSTVVEEAGEAAPSSNATRAMSASNVSHCRASSSALLKRARTSSRPS